MQTHASIDRGLLSELTAHLVEGMLEVPDHYFVALRCPKSMPFNRPLQALSFGAEAPIRHTRGVEMVGLLQLSPILCPNILDWGWAARKDTERVSPIGCCLHITYQVASSPLE